MIGKKRVPLGVVGIIYEARPNVTADAIGLCIKTGNAVILRGGSEAIRSNIAIVNAVKKAAAAAGMPEGAIALVEDTSREAASYLMTFKRVHRRTDTARRRRANTDCFKNGYHSRY